METTVNNEQQNQTVKHDDLVEALVKNRQCAANWALKYKIHGLLCEYGAIEFYDRLVEIWHWEAENLKDKEREILLTGLTYNAEKARDIAETLAAKDYIFQ
jgi:pantothenate kinase